MNVDAQHYLLDILRDLLDRAREAKRRAEDTGRSEGVEAAAFEHGRAMGYYEVVDHVIHQLDAFGIDRSLVGIDREFDPDRELLGSPTPRLSACAPPLNARAFARHMDLEEQHRQQAQLVKQVRAGHADAVRMLIKARAGSLAYEHYECYTIGRFDDLGSTPAPEAFSLLSVVATIAAETKDVREFTCALDLLDTLARATDTTERPHALVEVWPVPQAHSLNEEAQESWRNLCVRYRIRA
jgi:hypothetical protein